ncbi:hypothetical protein [Bradyrhizobium sp. AZCC 2289]|uniref:hypothetical protein n=1 Tax=Bradyrhizobium sp. AZCC 2289 TaxID=3117026 RepID=UPI002FEF049E
MTGDASSPPTGNIQTRPLENGNIEVKLSDGSKEIAVLTCTPQQLNEFVIGVLNAAHGAFVLAEKTPDENLGKINLPGIVPITQWNIGRTNVQGQNAIALQIGDVVVGLAVQNYRMRGLGRVLTASSWKVQSPSSLTSLLLSLLKDFLIDFRGWGGVFYARLNTSLRRFATSFWSKVSGKSLRMFRFISLGPDATLPTYAAANKCIYCGDKVYSNKPGIRQYPLGDEHIIAEGLGGKLELAKASCQSCEEVTGATVEGDVLGQTLKALRAHLKIRGKRTRPVPKTLPLTVQVNGRDTVQDIPTADYPVIFVMPICDAPPIFGNLEATLPPITGMTMVQLNYDEKKLRKQYGVTAFSTARWDTVMLSSMIAKIGHAFAIAEIGEAAFKPLLIGLILEQDRDSIRLIGGEPNLKPASKALH